jgi:hypothetical protein
MDHTERLEILSHKQDIADVLSRYCRAIDRLDHALLKSVYHDDGYDDHGVFKGNAHEFCDVIIPMLSELTTFTSHMLYQSEIGIEGDKAASETYFCSINRMRGGAENIEAYFGPTYTRAAQASDTLEKDHEYVAGGRYLDRFLRKDGAWRIQSRMVTNEWGRCSPLGLITTEGMIQHNYRPGSRDQSDPVYGLPGMQGCI